MVESTQTRLSHFLIGLNGLGVGLNQPKMTLIVSTLTVMRLAEYLIM